MNMNQWLEYEGQARHFRVQEKDAGAFKSNLPANAGAASGSQIRIGVG